jgi:hypothetical protein
VITIFVSTYNRIETLQRTINSFRGQRYPYEVVIVDNGSDDPQALNVLDELEPDVLKVFRFPKIRNYDDLTGHFNTAFLDLARSTSGEWYAVTDADICFEGSSPDSFSTYAALAAETELAIGPHTRVDAGISHGYPLRSRVLALESRLLYKDTMLWSGKVPYSEWQIDTTFHLFSRNLHFDRLHMGTARVGPPYDAMHLDWYVDFWNPTKENWVYINSREEPGSWGRAWIADYWRRFQESPERAFEFLAAQPRGANDFCNNSFMLSWAYQHGAGCAPDQIHSIQELSRAIPEGRREIWEHQRDWSLMIYHDDFTSLGWDEHFADTLNLG